MAYADMYDLMDLTESLLSGLVFKITGGSYKVKYHPEGPNSEKEYELDFSRPWKRFNMIEELEKQLKVTFPKGKDFEDKELMTKFLDDLCVKVSATASKRYHPKLIYHFHRTTWIAAHRGRIRDCLINLLENLSKTNASRLALSSDIRNSCRPSPSVTE